MAPNWKANKYYMKVVTDFPTWTQNKYYTCQKDVEMCIRDSEWTYQVDESKLEATIGNPMENAIWEEFGTGEYALNGDGRKGKWYIPIGNAEGQISQNVVDAYGMKVVHGKGGVDYVETSGKRAKRPFYTAYLAKKRCV